MRKCKENFEIEICSEFPEVASSFRREANRMKVSSPCDVRRRVVRR